MDISRRSVEKFRLFLSRHMSAKLAIFIYVVQNDLQVSAIPKDVLNS